MSENTVASCNPFEVQTREIAKQAYQSSYKYNADIASKQWTDQYYVTRARAAAKASAENFTFPVRVCEMDGTNISYATCFAMYNHESGILATSRYVADVQRSTSRETQLLARINGQWLPGKVLCPNELAESMGKESNLAVIKLDGDGRAPAGIPLGSASGTWAAFIAGFSNAKDKAAKFHMGEGSTLSLGMHEFGVTTPFRKSWTGGPVLDTTGHVVGVITGKKGEMTVATTAETLIFYSMVLDLEFPAYPGDSCSGEDIEYL